MPRLVAYDESLGGLPCSLLLLQRQDGAPDALIGFVRLVAVTRPQAPLAAYVEALCIDEPLRGRGLGKELLLRAEKYAAETLGCEHFYLLSEAEMRDYYVRLGYEEVPILSFGTLGGNLLLHFHKDGDRFGNEAPPGWETAYDGRPYISKEDIENQVYVHFALRKCLLDATH